MSSATPHRVDPPSTAVPRRVGPYAAGSKPRRENAEPRTDGNGVPAAGQVGQRIDRSHTTGLSGSSVPTDVAAQEDWLRLHATDLVDRLQSWASDLDAREAQLNARLSLQDHRERRFRLHQADVATELAEQQRSNERLRSEIQAQARRLAFLSDSPAHDGSTLPPG